MFDPNDFKGLNDLSDLEISAPNTMSATALTVPSALPIAPPTGFTDLDEEKTIPQAAFDDTADSARGELGEHGEHGEHGQLAMASDDDVILIDDEERAMLAMFGVLDAA